MPRGHYVRRNHQTLLPKRLIVLDTETIPERQGDTEAHRLRCACATRDVLDTAGRPVGLTEEFQTDTGEELWWWVTHAETRPPRTYLYAHNVQFDLLASGAFRHLPEHGWTLHRWAIGGRSDWFWWRRGRTSLVCLNSASWFPMPLEQVGQAVRTPKLPMPSRRASHEAWVDYCQRDVDVLRLAILRVIQWIGDQDLGSWRFTPAAQGFAAWRHRFMRMRPLAHGQPEAQRLERLSYHAGRCEAYRLGDLGTGPWAELDFQDAYPTLCRDHAVPAELIGIRGDVDLDRYRARPQTIGCIAEATVELDQPALPVRTDLGTCWPVGRFRAWLPGPELDLALELGADVQLHRVATYTMAPLLRDFATWILEQLHGPDPVTDPLLRAVVKRWGQSFVGRLGARRRGWERMADDPAFGVGVEYLAQAGADRLERRCRLAGAWWREADLGEGENAITAIAAWVTSLARVRLWRALQAAGRENVAYLDTDGLIVNAAGQERLEAALAAGQLPGLRVKRRLKRLEVWGPGAYQVDGVPRVKGLPTKVRPLKAGGWSGERWQGVLHAAEAGDVTRPLVKRDSWRVPEPEPRGQVVDAHTIGWERLPTGGAQAQLLGPADRVVVPYRVELHEGLTVIGSPA